MKIFTQNPLISVGLLVQALFSAKTLIIWKFTNSSAMEIDILMLSRWFIAFFSDLDSNFTEVIISLFTDANVCFFYR